MLPILLNNLNIVFQMPIPESRRDKTCLCLSSSTCLMEPAYSFNEVIEVHLGALRPPLIIHVLAK
jgi:hypothetical protein